MMPQIGAIVLAAGTSSRLGRPKQLLQLGNKAVFLHALDCALRNQLDPVVLVAGAHFDRIGQLLENRDLRGNVEVVQNREPERGMASSLQIGVQRLAGRVTAVVVFLADQPFVPDEVVQQLTTTYHKFRDQGCRIVRPTYAGVPGNPVLFDSDLFPDLFSLQGDTGARPLLKGTRFDLWTLPFNNPVWGMDVDTEEDWNRIQAVYKELGATAASGTEP